MPIDLRDQYFGTEIEMTGITRRVRHRWWQRCSVRTIIIGFRMTRGVRATNRERNGSSPVMEVSLRREK